MDNWAFEVCNQIILRKKEIRQGWLHEQYNRNIILKHFYIKLAFVKDLRLYQRLFSKVKLLFIMFLPRNVTNKQQQQTKLTFLTMNSKASFYRTA